MFWADRIAGDIKARFGARTPILIRDEKTLSGRVHIGSFRGVAIHGTLYETLTEAGVSAHFKYEYNDYDPMDGIPSYLDQKQYEQYLGVPLKHIPSPDPGYENFAEYFGAEFTKIIEDAGFKPEFYRSSELYLTGKMDGVIREALLGAADIRRIYKEVSGGSREDTWLPLSVICPTCGKLSTTRASDFNGETVQVECRDLEWVKGCGYNGRVTPFGGKAKLPWKVEWPAKWKVMGVLVEGAGKDHSTKGGSRDVANHISKEVFNYEPPFDVPYEFFLVGGKKMSSSKGAGSSAKEIAELVPAKILRLALIGKEITQAFNFDPEGDTIPVLYDQYDKLAQGYWAGVKDDYARLFEFIHPASKEVASKKSSGLLSSLLSKLAGRQARLFPRQLPSPQELPRFSQVAFVVQMPHMDLYKEFPQADKAELDERALYAKRWLEQYAPEKFVFKLQDALPEAARALEDNQKAALKELLAFIESSSTMPGGEELHKKLHDIKDTQQIKPAELFGAIYRAFLDKTSGPQAGWFISSLPREFVVKRLKEATQ